MNSHWEAHALAQKSLRPQNHSKCVIYLTLIIFILRLYVWVAHYWVCCQRDTSMSTACVRAWGGHFEHMQ